MSFIAGMVSIEGAVDPRERASFRAGVRCSGQDFPWGMSTTEGEGFILVQGGFPHLWQGPKLLSQERFEAVACGVQWRTIPGVSSTLAYLAERLTGKKRAQEDYFDVFSCGIVDKAGEVTVLASDSVGMAPIFYQVRKDLLVFSTRQTLFTRLLRDRQRIDRQGVLEYLIIGHNMGEKSLITGVRVLPPGARLVFGRNGVHVEHNRSALAGSPAEQVLGEEAPEAVVEYLERKCGSYGTLCPKPVAGFLSGGWDSRLIISLFQNRYPVVQTYTGQQRLQLDGRFISEKGIAREVAEFIGVPNQFVAPRYRRPENRSRRGAILDYATWFHDWAFSLAQAVPSDRYVLCDGLLGDVLLRGLHLPEELDRCRRSQDRDAAAAYFHERYVKGFNTYTRGIESWGSIIRSDVLADFSQVLLRQIRQEMDVTPGPDFVTLFLLRNRTRRGISPLPRWIFGRKGTVMLPFCSEGFVRLALSIPMDLRRNPSFYEAVLERSRPGLSAIPSTNSSDLSRMAPYLVDAISEIIGTDKAEGGVGTGVPDWVQGILDRPPEVFIDCLRPDLQKAIKEGNVSRLASCRFFLERVAMVQDCFS